MLRVLNALNGKYPEISGELEGHKVDFHNGEEALAGRLSRNNYDLMLFDGDITEVGKIKKADPRLELILFGKGNGTAVDAVSRGASAYFSSPVDPERFRRSLERIREQFAHRRETEELERTLAEKYTFSGIIISRSPGMLEIFSTVKRVAPYYRTALITGETGTGKELLAKCLHSMTPEPGAPFVVCNCGGLTENLIESELFGHRKGAFTGAVSDKKGLFEEAGEGNIFLDEIGELPLSFQPHFLRVLQDGEFRPVGETRPRKARCRVIAATNRDLSGDVAAGRFRGDLYYRLTGISINIVPLRERKEDIPLLARSFLGRFNQNSGREIRGVSMPAQRALMSHDWPGNVRELENAIHHAAMVTTESFIRLEDLPPAISAPRRPSQAPPLSLDRLVSGHIKEVLASCGGNRSTAAKMLGISRRALLRKMEKYSIT